MDESGRRETIGEAVIGLIFIFGILIFLIYKFGYANSTVENTDSQATKGEEISQQDFENSISPENTSSENQIYFKYIKKIYDEQNSNGKNANVDQIISQYQDELSQSVAIPEQVVTLQNVSATADRNKYNTEFENSFANLKARGGTSESKIFASQIADKDTLIPLSDYDKETLLRIATEYEAFANKISVLNTPVVYKQRGENTVKNSLNIAYILRKMVATDDKKIYGLWISKYTTTMLDILTSRYAK